MSYAAEPYQFSKSQSASFSPSRALKSDVKYTVSFEPNFQTVLLALVNTVYPLAGI